LKVSLRQLQTKTVSEHLKKICETSSFFPHKQHGVPPDHLLLFFPFYFGILQFNGLPDEWFEKKAFHAKTVNKL